MTAAEHIVAIQDYIEGIREFLPEAACLCKTAAEVKRSIAYLEARVITPVDYQEFYDQAIAVKEETLKAMRKVLTMRIQQEADVKALCDALRFASETLEEAMRYCENPLWSPSIVRRCARAVQSIHAILAEQRKPENPADDILIKAQEFANAWARVGSFDNGDAIEHAKTVKEELRRLIAMHCHSAAP